jgi:uncharacterized protein YgbK (DUF1537 family)
MRHHPLTPMTDANLVRVLGRQTPRRVGLVPWTDVRRGPQAIAGAFARLRKEGASYGVVDAVVDEDLDAIGEACADLALVTGGSGIALGLPANFRRRGTLPQRHDAEVLPDVLGKPAVLAGSCSEMTRRQVASMARTHAAVELDPRAAESPEALAESALAAVAGDLSAGRPFVVYSSADPERIAQVQREIGASRAAARVEAAFGALARALVARGVRRLIVAGGETSGAVVQALGIEALAIGPPIDPGVPWTTALGEPRLALALKSGNFGADDFFLKALAMLP